jgi:hypothetical protein
MTQLRSLGIELRSSNCRGDVSLEGNRYCEDVHGRISETSKRNAERCFDANYMTILSRSAPNLEELELIGHSKATRVRRRHFSHLACFNSIIQELLYSLQGFHQLRTLIISGAASGTPEFFRSSVYWSHYANIISRRFNDAHNYPGIYAPLSLQDAVSDLGNCCRTLEKIRFSSHVGQLFHSLDLTGTIVRDEIAGRVRGVRITKG